MKLYEHIKTFDVKYCDTDFKDELKPSAVLAYLEEVACSSADELGFGYSYLKPRGYAFMLTNIRCEFLSPVPLGAHITVKTWPTPPSYVVFGREYQILSESGDILMNATSRWCMVDMKSGRLLQFWIIGAIPLITLRARSTSIAGNFLRLLPKRGNCGFP